MSRRALPPASARSVAICHWLAIATLVALIALGVAWELWLAPLRPGGSLLALKVLPLLLPLFGILRGRRYTYQWAPMLAFAYFVEGVMRGYAESGIGSACGWSQALIASAFIASAAYYARDAHRLPAARVAASPGRN
ncbi:MAG: DUF2069 domain-containing protein [Pseudomonadota bacterium]|jgi:uncharacterized membrane protein